MKVSCTFSPLKSLVSKIVKTSPIRPPSLGFAENRSFRMLPNHKYMVDTEYYVSLVNFTAM